MDFMQRAQMDVVRLEHQERMREAERFRRANEARQGRQPITAARRERRFFVFRPASNRPTKA